MRTTKHLRVCWSLAAVVGVLAIIDSSSLTSSWAFQAVASQTEPDRLIHSVQGADLFGVYCASCHGVHGIGNGPAASALKKRPPDLTRIAERNGGIFPEDRVRNIIAGSAPAISAHGSREMPVWGPIFHQVERDQDWGDVRLQNLLVYLRSIQIAERKK
jgi:mono/diheme cytochrome c family protein